MHVEMKIAAVIVTYHPQMEDVVRNMASYANDVDLLVLWDNSEKPEDLSPILQAYPKTILHQDHCNAGLPTAYNWAYQLAKEQGCTHLMTMDQDSEFEQFLSYRSWLEKHDVPGITCVRINKGVAYDEEEVEIGTACQSGSVFPLAMLEQIGGFREDLFIAMVDAEMSLRAAEKGYKIIQYNGSNLKHMIGSRRKVKVLGHHIEVSDYNALRHYYDSRNRILLWHEFPNDYDFRGKLHHLAGRMKVMVKILLFEDHKCSKVAAIVRGSYNGFRNKAVSY